MPIKLLDEKDQDANAADIQEPEDKTDHYIDVKMSPGSYRRLYFKDEREKQLWFRMHKKSKLYIPYFLMGVGINFVLYFSGLDLSRDLLMGGLVGLGIPFTSMFLFSEIHFRIKYGGKNDFSTPDSNPG